MRRAAGAVAAAVLLLGGCAGSGEEQGAAGAADGGGVTPPPVDARWDIQLGGPRDVPDDVAIVERDRTAEPLGGYDICYVNAFQSQPDDQRWTGSDLVLRDAAGDPVIDEVWQEYIFDISSAAKRDELLAVVGPWIEGCADDGFDAVELDNLDSFARSEGLVRPRHARAFARLLTATAHAAGLAVAQKNWAEWDGTAAGFDLAIAEECGRYDECDRYVESYGDHVLVVEYRARDFVRTCTAHGDRLAVVLRDRDVTPDGVRRWC